MRFLALVLVVSLSAVACGGESTPTAVSDPTPGPTVTEVTADDEPSVEAALRLVNSVGPVLDTEALRELVATEDERWAWVLADVLRFYPVASGEAVGLGRAIEELTGFDLGRTSSWISATNGLIDADTPAPPGYPEVKQTLFGAADERWADLLDTVTGLDLRLVGWGGVFPDDRPFGTAAPCGGRGCIPALDEPAVTDAAGGDWYHDDNIVFGIVIDGEARAFPKNIMEVHEMVNDTLGGRQFAMPYCTLCGSAQAYFTDNVDGVDERLVLRTSGLLQRSNKVMFDLNTRSLWDTFLGVAGSGPLGEAGVELEQITVSVSTWGDWKAAHPDTTIVARDGGIGRAYSPDPLRGRDDDGPIFPIGDVDARLPVQEQVLTVEASDGTPVAFPVASARSTLEAGNEVKAAGVVLSTDGAGLKATADNGDELVTHQAFWFAWVQRHPDTALWEPSL